MRNSSVTVALVRVEFVSIHLHQDGEIEVTVAIDIDEVRRDRMSIVEFCGQVCGQSGDDEAAPPIDSNSVSESPPAT